MACSYLVRDNSEQTHEQSQKADHEQRSRTKSGKDAREVKREVPERWHPPFGASGDAFLQICIKSPYKLRTSAVQAPVQAPYKVTLYKPSPSHASSGAKGLRNLHNFRGPANKGPNNPRTRCPNKAPEQTLRTRFRTKWPRTK